MNICRSATAVAFIFSIVAGICWPTADAFAQPAHTTEFHDIQNRLIGRVIERPDGRFEARSYSNRYLGYFDPKANITYDSENRMVARGNFLPVLIDRVSQNSAANPRIERTPSRELKHPHSVIPNPTLEDRPIVPPEVKSRHGRMVPSLTQEDRFFAIDALQIAIKKRGVEINWRNPASGNSGSYITTGEVFETSVNGQINTCWWVRMTLQAASEIDIQRQGVCQRGDNQLWTVATVDADALYSR